MRDLQSHHLGIETLIRFPSWSGLCFLQSHHLGIETEFAHAIGGGHEHLQSHHLGIETDTGKVWNTGVLLSYNRTI